MNESPTTTSLGDGFEDVHNEGLPPSATELVNPVSQTVAEDKASFSHDPDQSRSYLAALALGALGVVYGDIGTSPLYSMRESFLGTPATRDNILGILSLIVWALVIVVTLKYVVLILRADNHGEGGILALASRVGQSPASKKPWFPAMLTLGLFGTALLYGDGMITPAISVLSAVEGLEVAYPALGPYILTIAVCILTLLFCLQYLGTEKVGKVFGPVTLFWFITLAALGVYQIIQEPSVLQALSPHHALRMVGYHGLKGFLVLGSIFLVATGGEALYADMGHFGARPIRYAWFVVVFPALLLNYFGQGALLLRDPSAADNPFFKMAPPSLLVGIIFLATAATVIASQALISGAYSLTMQAIRLNYLPRLRVIHTSSLQRGQIYVPAINWILMIACILLVLGFGSSSRLAAAYGVGVNLDMLIATSLFFVLAVYDWNWPWWKATLICGSFLGFELAFLVGNAAKIPSGGWFPLLVGITVFTIMSTWNRGRGIVARLFQARTVPLEQLLARLDRDAITRTPGTAVFMYSNPRGTPPALLSNLHHNQVLHQRVILLAVEILEQPGLGIQHRTQITPVGAGIFRVGVRFGYLERLDVPAALREVILDGEPLLPYKVSYFLGKENVIARKDILSGMAHWRELLFSVMSRNATDATKFFHLPPDKVVELGTQLEI